MTRLVAGVLGSIQNGLARFVHQRRVDVQQKIARMKQALAIAGIELQRVVVKIGAVALELGLRRPFLRLGACASESEEIKSHKVATEKGGISHTATFAAVLVVPQEPQSFSGSVVLSDEFDLCKENKNGDNAQNVFIYLRNGIVIDRRGG